MPIPRQIEEILTKTTQQMKRLDALSYKDAASLYASLEEAAKLATHHIEEIDPQLRVTACANLDKALERVIDSRTQGFNASAKYVFTPAIQDFRHWKNTELMKDKGLCGYLLAREIGARPVMYFGTKRWDYPYLSMLPDMTFLYGEGDKQEMAAAYAQHLSAHHGEMDVLVLHGMYEATLPYLAAYRSLRPDGRVFCGLDMNSWWMRKIPWNDEEIAGFASKCDVVATSCRHLRDELNGNPNVKFPCRWLPNGFFNPGGLSVIANVKRKRNVILTVGRIGTDQKNNEELLSAFAKASGDLRDWSLRLVGAIEPDFMPVIERFFNQRPDLRERVIFTGAVNEKEELFKEYAKAKLFVLTSRFEGGTPNVYAEALAHGCMFITSDIDAANDITNGGELGATYKRGEVNALAHSLVKLCAKANDRALQAHIIKAKAYAARYFDWNRNAKKLAYMLYKM